MERSSSLQLPTTSGSSQKLGSSSRDLSAITKPLGLVLLVLIMAVGMQSTTGLRFTLSACIFLLLSTLIWKYPAVGVPVTFSFLAVLGGLRRWFIPDFGWLSYDPLVLIGAAISLLSFFPILIKRKIPSDTPLSHYVKLLLVIMGIQALNPIQGGPLVSLGGILYYVCPLLWFYVGRVHGRKKVLSKLVVISCFVFTLTAIYGIKQVLFGLAPSEQEWMKMGGYEALNVSADAIRVFSTFASQQEYAITLACVISISASYIIHRKLLALLPVAIAIPALLLTAARGPIVGALLAVAVQWAISGHRRSPLIPRLLFALAVGVVGLGWSLSSINTGNLSAGQRDIIQHQQKGLLNPQGSTAPGHITMITGGILSSLGQPIGSGLGSTTIAAGKLGGEIVLGTESDYGNLFLSLGVVGGVMYLIVIFNVFKQTSVLWRESRHIVYLALLGLLVVCIGQWLSGGLYSLCFLIWFSIGVMDREFALKLAAENPAVPIPKQGLRPVTRAATRRIVGRRPALQPKALSYKPSSNP